MEELRQFLAGDDAGPALYPLWHLVAMTGMRRGEVCGLQWGDIDLERSDPDGASLPRPRRGVV